MARYRGGDGHYADVECAYAELKRYLVLSCKVVGHEDGEACRSQRGARSLSAFCGGRDGHLLTAMAFPPHLTRKRKQSGRQGNHRWRACPPINGPRRQQVRCTLSVPSASRLTPALLDFLDPMVDATRPNPVGPPNPLPIATIPFRGNCQGFVTNPVFLVRFASRSGNWCFSGTNIFGDHSVSFGFGFCASLGYPAQHARLRRPADARRLRR
jgi:hypothetical protein